MNDAKRRLKILWLSHLIPYPPKGGVLMRSHYLSAELARRHEVDLLALNQEGLLRAYYGSLARGLAECREALSGVFSRVGFLDLPVLQQTGGCVRLALKSLFSPLPYSIAWLQSDQMGRAIHAALQAKEYDLVHFDTLALAEYLPEGRGIPRILDHHNVESHMMSRRARKEYSLPRKLYFYQEAFRLRRYEQRILSRFQGHICCSEVDRSRLLSIDRDINVRTIPNPVEVRPRLPQPDPTAVRLLFIGGLDWYPNRDAVEHFLAGIWPRVLDRVPRVEFHVVGKHPPRGLRAAAKSEPRVRLHGFVDDIATFYQDSLVFVCPIRDGGGTKLKVLDAMAHGLAVVGYPEALEGIDLWPGVEAECGRDPADFTEALVRLLLDPERAKAMGQRARRLVEQRYQVARVGQAFSDYCLSVAEAR